MCRLTAILSITALSVAAVAACSPGTTAPPSATGDPPNVLLILVDALRADRLGVNASGKLLTPNLDRLTKEGVNFENAFSHSTWTKPSVATLITSLYPSQHGMQFVGVETPEGFRVEELAEGIETLAEGFQRAGYATGASVNQVHLHERFGFGQGYDLYKQVEGKDAFHVNSIIEDWLASIGDQPFFAYVHYLDTHWPYTRRLEKHEDQFGSTAMTSKPTGSAFKASEWAKGISPQDLAALETRYDYEVAYVDDAIGQMIDKLKELGRYDNTIIVTTSDHGEAFFEHQKLQHGGVPYDEVTRIPLAVRLPERLRPTITSSTELVGLIDVMPTLFDLAGLEPATNALGNSLRPLLSDESPSQRLVFIETFEAIGVRSETHKLLRYRDGRTEFFNLVADQAELSPVIDACSGSCAELERPLAAFERLLKQGRESNPSGRAFMTAAEVDRLRALGYLD